jgi:hypothetical protein
LVRRVGHSCQVGNEFLCVGRCPDEFGGVHRNQT